MRQAEQVHDMDAYTRPTYITNFSDRILVIDTTYLTIQTNIDIRWTEFYKVKYNIRP